MRKLIKIRKIVLVLFFILIAFITKTYLVAKNESEKELVEKQKMLEQDMAYTERMLQDRSMEIKKLSRSISNDVEIVVLKETGSIKLFHDKTPENNKYIEWIVDSNIALEVEYTAILTIDTGDIEVSYDASSDKINIIYDLEKIKVKSVNIDNILSETSKGIFGKVYSAKEVAALTLVATDKIKTEISNDSDLKKLASTNLEKYLKDLSYSLGTFNVNIVKK